MLPGQYVLASYMNDQLIVIHWVKGCIFGLKQFGIRQGRRMIFEAHSPAPDDHIVNQTKPKRTGDLVVIETMAIDKNRARARRGARR